MIYVIERKLRRKGAKWQPWISGNRNGLPMNRYELRMSVEFESEAFPNHDFRAAKYGRVR